MLAIIFCQNILQSLQVKSCFDSPFDSAKVGYHDVSHISIVSKAWSVHDVDSKCVCLPKEGRHPNPLPPQVLQLLASRNPTITAVRNAIDATIPRVKGQLIVPHWSISTLLPPGKYRWITFPSIPRTFWISEKHIIVCPTADGALLLFYFVTFYVMTKFDFWYQYVCFLYALCFGPMSFFFFFFFFFLSVFVIHILNVVCVKL